MGFFGKIKKLFKSAVAAHAKDDLLANELANIYQEQGYPVSGMKKKASSLKTKDDGTVKQKPERYSFTITTANGPVKIKTKSKMGVLSVCTKTGGKKGKKDKFRVNDFVNNDGGNLTIINKESLVPRVMTLL